MYSDEVSTARSELEAVYRRCAEAIDALDAAAFAQCFDPRTSSESHDDSIMTAQTRGYFDWRFTRTLQSVCFTWEMKSFDLVDDHAIVEFHETNEARVLDSAGQPVRRCAEVRERAVWKRSAAGWFQTQFEFMEPPVVTIDGDAANPEDDPVGWTAYMSATTPG